MAGDQSAEILASIDKSLQQIAFWLRYSALQTSEFQELKIYERCSLLKKTGLDNKEIASALGISEGSVRGHYPMQEGKQTKWSNKVSNKQNDKLSGTASALQVIANTLGFMVIQTDEIKDKSSKDKILLLNRLGFDRDTIAAIVGTTVGNVTKELSLARKSEKPS